jgi:hypothetical protein
VNVCRSCVRRELCPINDSQSSHPLHNLLTLFLLHAGRVPENLQGPHSNTIRAKERLHSSTFWQVGKPRRYTRAWLHCRLSSRVSKAHCRFRINNDTLKLEKSKYKQVGPHSLILLPSFLSLFLAVAMLFSQSCLLASAASAVLAQFVPLLRTLKIPQATWTFQCATKKSLLASASKTQLLNRTRDMSICLRTNIFSSGSSRPEVWTLKTRL